MSEIKSKLSLWFGNSFVTDKVLKNCAKESESLPAYAVWFRPRVLRYVCIVLV